MKVEYKPATIINIIEESAAVRRFFFKLPDTEVFTFKSGQFVMIDLPIESKITNRSYSIASAPNTQNTFELIIVLNPSGIGTPHIWENYKIGDVVPVSGPLGKFILPDDISTEICFIATGTGIAPLRSMLYDILENNRSQRPIYLIFGCRTRHDILYQKEMETLEHKYPQFKFIPVLSRADEHWNGVKGYVHQVYEQIYHANQPVTFYLCGWKNMIHEARERLLKLGYDKSHVKFELYD